MVQVGSYNGTPGLPATASETYTQKNTILAGQAPTMTRYGKTTSDLPVYSLVGRVTGTQLLVLSDPAAADGSQLPVGVTTHAVVNDDSNSGLVDSNSLAGADVVDVAFYPDGVFNFDELNKHGSWTLPTLQAALDRTPLNVDVIQTATPPIQG